MTAISSPRPRVSAGSPPRRPRAALAGAVLCFLALSLLTPRVFGQSAGQSARPPVVIDQESPVAAPEGHTVVSWSLDTAEAGLVFELEQATAEDFSDAVAHQVGSDRSRFITGLPEGDNYIRVRSGTPDGAWGEWSEPLLVRVDYPPMSTVWVLMALGTLMLVATAGLILSGHRRMKREMAQ